MNLTTSEKIALAGLIVGILACIGTYLTVPEVREFIARLRDSQKTVQGTPTNVYGSEIPSPPTTVSKPTVQATAFAESVLFEENFADGKAKGFTYWDGGTWNVVTDETGNKVYEIDNRNGSKHPRLIFGSLDWKNYALEYRTRMLDSKGEAGILTYFRSENFVNYDLQLQRYWGRVVVGLWDGIEREIKGQSFYWVNGRWYSVRVEVKNIQIRVLIDQSLIIDVTDSRRDKGAVGLAVSPGMYAQFDDIRVTALGSQ